MNNFMETLKLLEERASGVVSWLTSQSSQLKAMEDQLEKVRVDIADMFTQISAIRSEISKMKGS